MNSHCKWGACVWGRVLFVLGLWGCPAYLVAQPSYAFFYGAAPLPVAELSAFDHVVVEPNSGFLPSQVNTPQTEWLAYTSVGEVTRQRDYFQDIPKAWLKGGNRAWDSRVIDQAANGWPDFFVERVITPLWQRGFRGFFLDTLDSFGLIAQTPLARAEQIAGLVRVIRAIKARYPQAKLVFNRGFEILPQVYPLVSAVAFESLFKSWDQRTKRFVDVSQADRDWLLAQVKPLRDDYRIPVIAIDYCADTDRRCAVQTAARIRALGLIPYVSDPGLQRVGVGVRQPLPRRVLMLQDTPAHLSENVSAAVLYLATPLHYLGLGFVNVNVNQDPLPEGPLSDRYAGVILWLNDRVRQPVQLQSWIARQLADGVRLIFINTFGMPVAGQFARMLSLQPVAGDITRPLKVTHAERSLIGFEMPAIPHPRDNTPVRLGAEGRSLLHLQAGEVELDAAAIMPWGGYVMRPFAVFNMEEVGQTRWVLQPFEFLRQALRLPDMPIPDPTTENGLRLLMSHVDGDGFASKVEFRDAAGATYASEALYPILKQYGLPVTFSVIEGELSDEGPNTAIAARLRGVARQIFTLPNVEMASHTYSHPLPWMAVTGEGVATSDYSLAEGVNTVANNGLAIKIPGYRFDLTREINGSITQINRLMAPPGKKVAVLLWSGDCQVPAVAIKQAAQAGVLAMNGGDTLITHSRPSLTAVAPPGVMKGGYFQVFAPNQNEEAYTHLWQGPYYGYRRVLETFALTEQPRRLKPIDIYYHVFSATKQASLSALHQVLRTVLQQPLHPVFVSDYVRKVLDSEETSVAREDDFWVVRHSGALRTVRIAADRAPDLSSAEGVAGFLPGPDGVFVHMTGPQARFRLIPLNRGQAASLPWLASANGRITDFQRTPGHMQFDLAAYVAPHFTLANAQGCQVRIDGKSHSGQQQQHQTVFRLGAVGIPVSARVKSVHVDVDCRA